MNRYDALLLILIVYDMLAHFFNLIGYPEIGFQFLTYPYGSYEYEALWTFYWTVAFLLLCLSILKRYDS